MSVIRCSWIDCKFLPGEGKKTSCPGLDQSFGRPWNAFFFKWALNKNKSPGKMQIILLCISIAGHSFWYSQPLQLNIRWHLLTKICCWISLLDPDAYAKYKILRLLKSKQAKALEAITPQGKLTDAAASQEGSNASQNNIGGWVRS